MFLFDGLVFLGGGRACVFFFKVEEYGEDLSMAQIAQGG